MVAVKVLRPELAAILGPERFLREIQHRLQRYSIPTSFRSSTRAQPAAFLYYVMPYVEGESLRERLQNAKASCRCSRRCACCATWPMPWLRRMRKGVVHRDIKPENIMLSGRHALVADFGVAKAVTEATGRHALTTAGLALGTPTYMAPEQAAADPHVDHRADLYAFGATAYEVLTGQPPFLGLTAQAILAAHLTQTPIPVTRAAGDDPSATGATHHALSCQEAGGPPAKRRRNSRGARGGGNAEWWRDADGHQTGTRPSRR